MHAIICDYCNKILNPATEAFISGTKIERNNIDKTFDMCMDCFGACETELMRIKMLQTVQKHKEEVSNTKCKKEDKVGNEW